MCPEGYKFGSSGPGTWIFGCQDPTLHGTPPLVTKSYDCGMRTHAWEFAKKMLPRRGSFRTVFDALRLQTCNLTAPPTLDAYVPPNFATPSASAAAVLWVDARAPEFGGRNGFPPPEKNGLVLSILKMGCADTVPVQPKPNTPF